MHVEYAVGYNHAVVCLHCSTFTLYTVNGLDQSFWMFHFSELQPSGSLSNAVLKSPPNFQICRSISPQIFHFLSPTDSKKLHGNM